MDTKQPISEVQLSFLDGIMMQELSNFLKTENIKHHANDKMILFETNTFSKLVHRIEVDWKTEEGYELTLSQPRKRQKKLTFSNTQELVNYVKILQN